MLSETVLMRINVCLCFQVDLSFTFAHNLEDVLNAAFDDGFPDLADATQPVLSKL